MIKSLRNSSRVKLLLHTGKLKASLSTFLEGATETSTQDRLTLSPVALVIALAAQAEIKLRSVSTTEVKHVNSFSFHCSAQSQVERRRVQVARKVSVKIYPEFAFKVVKLLRQPY